MDSFETKPQVNIVPPNSGLPKFNKTKYLILLLVIVLAVAGIVFYALKSKNLTNQNTATKPVPRTKGALGSSVEVGKAQNLTLTGFPTDLPDEAQKALDASAAKSNKTVLSFTSENKITDEYQTYKQYFETKGWAVTDTNQSSTSTIKTLQALNPVEDHIAYLSFAPTNDNKTQILFNYILVSTK